MNQDIRRKQKKRDLSTQLKTVQQLFKQAFVINKNPYPWGKAFTAGIAAALPVFIGMLLGHLEYGLLAGIGAFTYLYVFDIPYVQRAKKIFWAMLGISFSVFLGTLLAPYPIAVALAMGLIGAIAIYIFGALKIAGPSAIFFVLSFALATGMDVDPSLAPLRGGLVLLGGVLSWILSMLGWFKNPHGPEMKAVKQVFLALADVFDCLGTDGWNQARAKMFSALTKAEETLVSGYSPKTSTIQLKRLFLLNEHASKVYLDVLDYSLEQHQPVPKELGESVRAIALTIGTNKKNDAIILQPIEMDHRIQTFFEKIYDADAIMNESVARINQDLKVSKPSLKTILLGAFDKNSIVFRTSVRYGVVITIAAFIAYFLDFERSYWIPLSCAAVMSGATIIATFHRTVQRMIGTIIGLIIAGIILSVVHNGYVISLIILFLTFFTELFIVRNYGLAAMFFTPSALVITEYTSQVFDFSFFAGVRLIDIVIGSIIGFIGAALVGSRSASNLLPHYFAKTIRSQSQLLLSLFSESNENLSYDENKERGKMVTNLTNLQIVYNTALGELFSNKKRLHAVWPIYFSIEQLGYYLDSSLKLNQRPILPEKDQAQLLFILESLAMAIDKNQTTTVKNVPEIEGYQKIQNEIIELQKAIRFKETELGTN